MQSKTRRISRQSIALVHVAAHQLGMSDADYRALLMGTAGVASARDLSVAGFEAVMRRFATLGFAHTKPGKSAAPKAAPAPAYGERPGMASPAQVHTIRELWRTWRDDQGRDGSETARALRHWLERHYHVTDLRFCDLTTAQKAIEGLKAMNGRKQRAASKETNHD
ncbi:MAG: hypothetical protein ABS38_12600 [Acidovorax sp. SCN 68-22]|nr:MAG: hypothetical protein ABS38_12600 [Acidovorax sp. SCN 68-22]